MPTSEQWVWLVIVAGASLSAHFCLAQALKLAQASKILVLDFLRMPLIAIIGYLLYEETVDLWTLAGSVIILGASLYNMKAIKSNESPA